MLPSEPHPALARHTGFLLSRMGMLAQRLFAERLNTLGLTPRMWGAMNVLEDEGAISQHALCRCVGMDPSTMVSTVDELERRGLVERRRHPSDRRAYALHLTELGTQTLAQGRKLARQSQQELLAPLSEPERAVLHDLLFRLAAQGAELAKPPTPPSPPAPSPPAPSPPPAAAAPSS